MAICSLVKYQIQRVLGGLNGCTLVLVLIDGEVQDNHIRMITMKDLKKTLEIIKILL